MPLDAPVTRADVNGKEVMWPGYARGGRAESAYDCAVRTDSWSFALLASLSLLAACGDGIDEGAGRPATGDTADTVNSHDTVTPTTVAPSPPAPLTIQLSETDVEHSNATYSGAHSVTQLDNGTYLLSGFDNHSDADHPERGALWRSTDLQRWERIGAEISDADNQQTIARVLSIDDLGIVLGTDYSRSSDPQDFSRFDATVWLTDDEGGSFTAVRIARDARVLSGSIIGDEIVVWGSPIEHGTQDRLKALREANLIGHGDKGYNLTAGGADLLKRLSDLQAFAAKWTASQARKK